MHKFKRRQKFRRIEVSLPIDLKRSCVKRPICFFQKMSDQTSYDVKKVKKIKKCFQRFLLINSSKVKRRKKIIIHELDYEDKIEEVKND